MERTGAVLSRSALLKQKLEAVKDKVTVDKALNPNGSRKQQPKYVAVCP